MIELKKKIKEQGDIKKGELVKVDSFLNHQVDIKLMNKIGREFKKRFSDLKVDKILTAEVSGIAVAVIAAQYFDVDVVFAKKRESQNLSEEVYSTDVYSYTGGKTYKIMVDKNYINEGENILIIDDFLANGKAVTGLIDLVNKADANLVGIGVAIEKGFQVGGQALRDEGIRLESLAIIDSIEDGNIVFR